MIAVFILGGLALLAALQVIAAVFAASWWWIGAGIAAALHVVGIYDVFQRRHSVLRNYPVLGHARYVLESLRPELQQYFIERDEDGRPFPRNTRAIIYERSEGIHGEKAFGTECDVGAVGYEFLVHSIHLAPQLGDPPRVRIGGLSEYHLRHGGDLVWEIGIGYFGARTDHGDFDADMFADKAAHDSVRMVELKLSQGAKPGIGGVLPATKVTAEIAAARSVPVGEICISPPAHRVFSTPPELVRFIARMRELADGKPTGFKLCVGSRTQVIAICKAMLAEGGTGAAPLEFEDNVGVPLTEGLIVVHNALVGSGLRDRGPHRRQRQGGDRERPGQTPGPRGGLHQRGAGHDDGHRVHPGPALSHRHLPGGRDHPGPQAGPGPGRGRQEPAGAQVPGSHRGAGLAAGGCHGPARPGRARPQHLLRRVDHVTTHSYADLFEWLAPGQLLAEPPESWAADWADADPDTFATKE